MNDPRLPSNSLSWRSVRVMPQNIAHKAHSTASPMPSQMNTKAWRIPWQPAFRQAVSSLPCAMDQNPGALVQWNVIPPKPTPNQWRSPPSHFRKPFSLLWKPRLKESFKAALLARTRVQEIIYGMPGSSGLVQKLGINNELANFKSSSGHSGAEHSSTANPCT